MTEIESGRFSPLTAPLAGAYVLVRCREAGVHAGRLAAADGRACLLTESRRLWYWKPADGGAFLSGVAAKGLDHEASRIGAPIDIYLSENCEIARCSEAAKASIATAPVYEPE